jgi:acetyl esterase/lipase
MTRVAPREDSRRRLRAPWRDEGIEYAKTLAEAGVQVQHAPIDDLVHGYLAFAQHLPRPAAVVTLKRRTANCDHQAGSVFLSCFQ